jgi:hypothetical protein
MDGDDDRPPAARALDAATAGAVSKTPFEQGTVRWHLAGAATRMLMVTVAINDVRAELSKARDVAVKEKLPTDQIVELQGDLDALEHHENCQLWVFGTKSGHADMFELADECVDPRRAFLKP